MGSGQGNKESTKYAGPNINIETEVGEEITVGRVHFSIAT